MNGNFDDIYENKNVLVTGHTGFKGSWLCIWLKELGANIIGYALEPYTKKDNFVVTGLKNKITHIIGDIRDYQNLKEVFNKYQPEFVFHLAAQPLVMLSYKQPKLTYDTNIGGTVNLFECCRTNDSVKVIINVTSDKCYENKEWIWGYRENDPVGGYDPYSSSKGCSELITNAYRKSFFNDRNKAISSVRAGNVIGGGDWQIDRIVPDCIKALKNYKPIEIRSPNSVRPWQYVLEPLYGYLLLASKMYIHKQKYSGAWNFGADYSSIITVKELVKKVVKHWGTGSLKLVNNITNKLHEAQLLSLDTSKVRNYLGWFPVLTIDEATKLTVDWYKNENMRYSYDVSQIEYYLEKWNSRIKSF